MKRFVVRERGRAALPPVDLADAAISIGCGENARIRLPASVAARDHITIRNGHWHAHAAVVVDGVRVVAGQRGRCDRVCFVLGDYEVTVEPSPQDAAAATPQRTESLARELVRSILGASAAPTLHYGEATRVLAPPDSRLVIGRGDDADWRILEGDLSREHAAILYGWDGVTILDLGSKNGTSVDGVVIERATRLSDGARIELAGIELVFRDPAERHLAANAVVEPQVAVQQPAPRGRNGIERGILLAIIAAASAAFVWVLIS